MSKTTKKVNIGDVESGRGVTIGGGSPIAIQSMTNTDTRDVEASYKQVLELYNAGCEIIRLTVPDMDAAIALGKLKKRFMDAPLVADIHFDYRLAIECIKQGVDKIRMNPGNIGSKECVREVVKAAESANVPIRIGVNAGSLEKDILEKNGLSADALVESALRHIEFLEEWGFDNIVVSLKASNIAIMQEAYRKMATVRNYPLHVGVTEAGSILRGTVKSTIGMAPLLNEDIGDTIRVSLTGDPVNEVTVAKSLLENMGLRKSGIEFVSCPTCGRTHIDLPRLVDELEHRSGDIERALRLTGKHIKVAVMGCIVNGPGEARDADIGIAGGNGEGLLFKKGESIGKLPQERIVDVLLDEMRKYI